jgi:hypothetical protein
MSHIGFRCAQSAAEAGQASSLPANDKDNKTNNTTGSASPVTHTKP